MEIKTKHKKKTVKTNSYHIMNYLPRLRDPGYRSDQNPIKNGKEKRNMSCVLGQKKALYILAIDDTKQVVTHLGPV